MMRTATFKLCGQPSGGPSGCPGQSKSRMRCPISPPLARDLTGLMISGSDFTVHSLSFPRKPHNFGDKAISCLVIARRTDKDEQDGDMTLNPYRVSTLSLPNNVRRSLPERPA